MSPRNALSVDKALAHVCLNCPVCRNARRQQRGPAFWLVTRVEAKLCPFCRAFERVYGRKAHAGKSPSARPTGAQTRPQQ